jgi:hypothetical protein
VATRLTIGKFFKVNITRPSPLEVVALSVVLLFVLLAALLWK